MVAYSFERRFVEPILIGLEAGPPKLGAKRQTIRMERRRHAKPGERMQLYFAQRTKQCRFLGEPRCVGAWPVVLRFLPTPSVELEGLRPPRSPAELDDFARRDGFLGWQELHDFWAIFHRGAIATQFSGVLLTWLP